MSCLVTWVTWVHDWSGSVGAWVKFLRELRGLRGSKYFYVGHNFYVGWVGMIYFCVGQIVFCVASLYLLDEIILLYYN